MKKNNLIFVFLISLFVGTSVRALTYGGCEYSEVSKLKSYVSNINLSYEYYIYDNQAYFNIILTNVVPGIYFVDSETGITYTYDLSDDGEIIISDKLNGRNGSFRFYSEKGNCNGVKISDKYYKLPTYNIYHNNPLCLENKISEFCKKWTEVTFSYEDLKNALEKSKVEEPMEEEISTDIYETTFLDKAVKFYTKYYYIVLITIIIFCVSIMIIDRNKNRFDI